MDFQFCHFAILEKITVDIPHANTPGSVEPLVVSASFSCFFVCENLSHKSRRNNGLSNVSILRKVEKENGSCGRSYGQWHFRDFHVCRQNQMPRDTCREICHRESMVDLVHLENQIHSNQLIVVFGNFTSNLNISDFKRVLRS